MQNSIQFTTPQFSQPPYLNNVERQHNLTRQWAANTNSPNPFSVADKVTVSPEGKIVGEEASQAEEQQTQDTTTHSPVDEQNLSKEELQELQKLQKRDAEVKAHEQAHKAVAGQYAAGGPSYSYETGPNGKRYAVGGEVPIDLSKAGTPEETIQKMSIVSKAALAPANPSSADRKIAAKAAMIAAQARREMMADVSQGNLEAVGQPAAEGTSPEQSSGTPVSENPVSPNTRHMVLRTYQSQMRQL